MIISSLLIFSFLGLLSSIILSFDLDQFVFALAFCFLLFSKIYVNDFKLKYTTLFFLIALLGSYCFAAIWQGYALNMAGLEFLAVLSFMALLFPYRGNFQYLFRIFDVVVIITSIVLLVTIDFKGTRVVSIFGGGYSIVLALSSFVYLYSRQKALKFLFLLPLTALAFYQSRMSMVVVLFVVFYLGDRKTILFLALLAFPVAGSFLYLSDSRLFELNTSGRMYYWLIMVDELFGNVDRLLFGFGDRASYTFFQELGVNRSIASPHNEYLRLLYDQGLIYFCVCGVLFFFIWKGMPNKRSRVFLYVLAMQMLSDVTLSYSINVIILLLCSALYSSKGYSYEKRHMVD